MDYSIAKPVTVIFRGAVTEKVSKVLEDSKKENHYFLIKRCLDSLLAVGEFRRNGCKVREILIKKDGNESFSHDSDYSLIDHYDYSLCILCDENEHVENGFFKIVETIYP